MLTAVLLFLAQPGDVVQTHDLGTMTWQRAKALEGRRVDVRFTVEYTARVSSRGEKLAVVVEVVGPADEGRFVTLLMRDFPALKVGTRLEAEGVLRVKWYPGQTRVHDRVSISLENARLVK